MSKTIFEYNINQYGQPYKGRFTIVYENKTYYYCKVNGTDVLKEINKDLVNTPSSIYFTDDCDKTISLSLQRKSITCEIARLQDARRRVQENIEYYRTGEENSLKELSKIDSQLSELHHSLKETEEEMKERDLGKRLKL